MKILTLLLSLIITFQVTNAADSTSSLTCYAKLIAKDPTYGGVSFSLTRPVSTIFIGPGFETNVINVEPLQIKFMAYNSGGELRMTVEKSDGKITLGSHTKDGSYFLEIPYNRTITAEVFGKLGYDNTQEKQATQLHYECSIATNP